jgi:hypothetical protein
MFSPISGKLLGKFVVDAALPWELDKAIIDPTGIHKPRRVPPNGLEETRDGQAIMYRATIRFDEKGIEQPIPAKFGVVWKCPGPDMGNAVVIVNYRKKNEQKWNKLSYSLKESPIR